jgi:large subunit ribosomal protein L25
MVQELKAELRKEQGTRNMVRLRGQGRIPAVIYGAERKEATPLSVDSKDFLNLLHKGERVLVLKIGDQTAQVLIKAVQYDHLGDFILHVDFNELRAGQTVQVRIPVVLKGTPKGQAEAGVLSHVLHEVEVECQPTAIPEKITLEVDALEIGDSLKVSDLKLPAGVKVLTPGTDVVAACIAPRAEEVAAPTPAEGGALEPEVLMEKKPEEGEGAEGAAKPEGDAKAAAKPAAEPKKKEAK